VGRRTAEAETGGDRSDSALPTLLYVIKQVELATRARLDDLFRPIGMTALQYTALTVLDRHPDLTSAQLARRSFVTDQAMAGMVTTLAERRLIERHRDAGDRRRLVLALTAEGSRVIDRYRDEVAVIEARMLDGIGSRDEATLRRLLDRCRRNLA
jgi:DNA-binding MarR family transcriptional regulator